MPDRLHPLIGCELRVARAREHMETLDAHGQKWAELHWQHIALERQADGRLLPVQTAELPVLELAKASVYIGDVLTNLRAALDYLVYVLAMVGNGGNEVPGTQFPIEDDMENFWARVTGKRADNGERRAQYLRKVPRGAYMRLAQLQPGWNPPCEWTRKLRELSNPDKHRHLSSLSSRGNITGTATETSDSDAVVNGEIEVFILFSDTGEEVGETLDLLHSQVASVIEEFKPAFQSGKSGTV